MAASRPDIPRRLAARITAAQKRVKGLRNTLVRHHKGRLQAQAELDRFHDDPEAYAADRYGNNGVDSYPVQTRTRRLAGEVSYRTRRIAELEQEMPDAEADLAAIEHYVLAEVLAMPPSPGRVPWPKRLPSFGGSIARGLQAQQREIDAEPARVAAYRARLKAQYDREIERLDQQAQREEEAERRRFERLPAARQEAIHAELKTFREVLEEKGMSAGDLFQDLSVSDAFGEVLREVSARIARSPKMD